MKSFFSLDNEGERLPMQNADVVYFPDFLKPHETRDYYDQLMNETQWQQDDIKIFGKVHAQPRLTCLYGNNGKNYSYSNIVMQPHKFTHLLEGLKARVEIKGQCDFTTFRMNLYRNGNDSNGWHADDEKGLGMNPSIASLSFGATRKFKLRRKDDHGKVLDINLQSGSLLLMRGCTQHFWQHQLPKTKKPVAPRINLTFRRID